jgi:hypothetical protein
VLVLVGGRDVVGRNVGQNAVLAAALRNRPATGVYCRENLSGISVVVLAEAVVGGFALEID